MLFLVLSGFVFTSDGYDNKNIETNTNTNTLLNTSEDQSDIESVPERQQPWRIARQTNYRHEYKDSIIKLTGKNPYGFTNSIFDFYKNEYFHVSVWRYGDNDEGMLVADGINDSRLYSVQNKPGIIKANGWQLLTLDVHIPPYYEFNELRIYVWNKGTKAVYFRDLTIERLPEKIYPEFEQPALEIKTDSAAFRKLESIRNAAYKKGILETGEDDYVKARLIYGTDTLKASIRLKGDWLDHLVGSKWSFRIKMRKEDSWKNMRSFSLQSPATRGFLDEWFVHRILASEDVLTTRYGFVPVTLNGKSLGIYAYEEHFDKHLVESNNRREGPILKFSEELFWTVQKRYIAEGKNYQIPFFDASDIEPFKENRTFNDKILYDEFLIAQNLLFQFKNDLRPVSEIFDLQSLARYYALCDITKTYHGFTWHNTRFYYNPVISRLEPVAFDCYPSPGITFYSDNNLIIEMAGKSKIATKAANLLITPFKQKEFVNAYIFYLNKYSKDKFLDSIYHSLIPEMDSLADLIKKEFGYYKFDFSLYNNNCKGIRRYLETHREICGKSVYGVKRIQELDADKELPDDFIPFLIKIFRNRTNEDSVLYLTSYYPEEILLSGYSDNKSAIEYETDSILIPVKSYRYPLKIDRPDFADYLFFKVKNRNNLLSIPVFQWEMPFDYAPYQELSEKYKIENQTLLKLDEDTLIIEGRLDISESLIIPGGYVVSIKPGTELNLMNQSTFISYSPVYARGTKTQPVRITSSDGTAMGFNIFQSKGRSILENVMIDQLNTLDYKGWTLTGSVNFYESDVDLINVTFKDNRCEDALNIIRSDFLMTGCLFDNIFADAFDSDYSNGTLTSCKFRDIANDALDFSGSKTIITGCEILHAGDKAISCGERSEITVDTVRINKANVAFASKDLSRLTISNSLISNSNYSYVAFKKKPEFGGAEIHVINTAVKSINSGQLIEQGSVIYLDDKPVRGSSEDVAEKFYVN